MKARLFAAVVVALAFPQAAFARGEFDPVKEFEQHEWVSIHLGPLDLSITKAVVYLMLGTVVTIFLDDLDAHVAAIAARGLEPDEREAYSNGVRKALYRDPDGNELGFAGAPLDARS